MADPGTAPLRLLAHDAADLPVLSALVQDAAVPVATVHFDPRARRFVLLMRRYRWEAGTATRVAAALRVESVLKAERRAWPRHADAVLALLAVRTEGDTVTLIFSGGVEARLTAEAIDVVLEDLGEEAPAATEPAHG